jgi:hypothetical protein
MHQAFLEISNAAAILGNPRKRKLYDRNFIDETGKLTQAGHAHAVRARRAAIFGGAFIAAIASVLIFNFLGPALESNRKSVQSVPPDQKIAAAQPSPAAVPSSPAPETKNGANKPASQPASGAASAQANAQDYLPPAGPPQPKNDTVEAPGQPSQEPARPRWQAQRQSHEPSRVERTPRLAQSTEPNSAADFRERDIGLRKPHYRGETEVSPSPTLRTAQCLACLTDDRANCSKICQ